MYEPPPKGFFFCKKNGPVPEGIWGTERWQESETLENDFFLRNKKGHEWKGSHNRT